MLPLRKGVLVSIAKWPIPTHVSPSARPPEGEDWFHEIKHDGHRLAAILDGRRGLKLISRRGYDRTSLFGGLYTNVKLVYKSPCLAF